MSTVHLALTSTTQASQALAVSTAVGNVIASITSQPAWSQVNTVGGVGSGSWTYTTLKNDHTVSGLAQDFYVTFVYNSVPSLYVILSESFTAAGVSDVQTISVTGSPTGGSFAYKYGASSVGSLTFNATAATFQTQLNGFIGANSVTVTGGPLPTTPLTVTFTGNGLNNSASPSLINANTNGLTGGSSPAPVYAHTTQGAAQCMMTYPANTYFNTYTSDASGRIPSTSVAGANTTTGAPTGIGTLANNVAAGWGYSAYSTTVYPLANTTIFYNVTTYVDHFVLGFGTTALNVHPVYYGAATSLIPTAATNDPFAVGTFALIPTTTNAGMAQGGFTRVPQFQWGVNTYWPGITPYTGLYAGTGSAEYQPALQVFLSGTANTLDPQANVYAVSRLLLPIMTNNSSSTNAQYILFRAALNNYVITSALPTGMVYGDTVALNGTYWMYVGAQSGTSVQGYIDTGVAV